MFSVKLTGISPKKKRPTGDFSGNNAPDNGLNPPQNKSS